MPERLIIAAIVIGGAALAISLSRRAVAIRDRRIVQRLRDELPINADRASHVPRIIYFTTTSCVVCRMQQQPVMEELLDKLPELEIRKYDAVEKRELADRYGVLSVPTTVVYDRDGELVGINRGFAPAAVLYAQVTGVEITRDGG
jgi:thiol-disulfide isomerase/thioredoxin